MNFINVLDLLGSAIDTAMIMGRIPFGPCTPVSVSIIIKNKILIEKFEL